MCGCLRATSGVTGDTFIDSVLSDIGLKTEEIMERIGNGGCFCA